MDITPVTAAQRILDSGMVEANQAPLLSIFSQLEGGYQPQANTPIWIEPNQFALTDQVLFPKPRTEIPPNAVRDSFTRYTQALREQGHHANPELRLEQHLAILQEYGWSLPSQQPAISLYDDLRIKAAIAAVQAHGDQQIMLCGGDLSGIQTFLYTIKPQKAAKSLRARSVYLQLLTDAVAHWILQQSRMPATNLIYSGGGRFYVLIPHTSNDDLNAWHRQLNDVFFAAHRGELYMAFGWSEFAPNAPVANSWQIINETINADKRRKFANLSPENLNNLFEPHGYGGNTADACAVCGYLDFKQNLIPQSNDEGESEFLCTLCASFVKDMADELRDARLLCINYHQASLSTSMQVFFNQRPSWSAILKAFGMSVWFKHRGDFAQFEAGRTLRVGLLDGQPLDDLRRMYPKHVFYHRPMVNLIPTTRKTQPNGRETTRTKEFNDLVADSIGYKRLGVLRMDVDDLGSLFASISKSNPLYGIPALSSTLSQFFEGYIGVLCKQYASRQNGTTHLIYSVYSGGDDLFLVGAWDVMPELALAISNNLKRYSGDHPAIHISGGLTLHGAKYPLAQAAQDAGEALEQAKALNGKNALCFLEQSMHWDALESQQLPYSVIPLVKQLHAFLNDEKPLSASFLQLLQTLYRTYTQSLKNTQSGQYQVQFGPWVWRGEYMFTRLIERTKNTRIRPFIEKVRHDYAESFNKAFDKNFYPHAGMTLIERLGLAARWTQLLNRKQEDRHGTDQ